MKTMDAQNSNSVSRQALQKSLKVKKKGFARRHTRHDCVVIGTMKIIEVDAEFDGALLELSQGGCTFRQASMFALDRLNEVVLIHTEFFEVEGRIRAVRADGYGIQFFNEIDQSVIDQIVREYGFNISESYLAKKN